MHETILLVFTDKIEILDITLQLIARVSEVGGKYNNIVLFCDTVEKIMDCRPPSTTTILYFSSAQHQNANIKALFIFIRLIVIPTSTLVTTEHPVINSI